MYNFKEKVGKEKMSGNCLLLMGSQWRTLTQRKWKLLYGSIWKVDA